MKQKSKLGLWREENKWALLFIVADFSPKNFALSFSGVVSGLSSFCKALLLEVLDVYLRPGLTGRI